MNALKCMEHFERTASAAPKGWSAGLRVINERKYTRNNLNFFGLYEKLVGEIKSPPAPLFLRGEHLCPSLGKRGLKGALLFSLKEFNHHVLPIFGQKKHGSLFSAICVHLRSFAFSFSCVFYTNA